MFGIILRIPGTATALNDKLVPSYFNPDDAPITAMCNVTGGIIVDFESFDTTFT